MQRKRLKEMRSSLELTQQQLADRIHMSRTRYVELENGANISYDQMMLISSALEQRVIELVNERYRKIADIKKEITSLEQTQVHGMILFERCYEE